MPMTAPIVKPCLYQNTNECAKSVDLVAAHRSIKEYHESRLSAVIDSTNSSMRRWRYCSSRPRSKLSFPMIRKHGFEANQGLELNKLIVRIHEIAEIKNCPGKTIGQLLAAARVLFSRRNSECPSVFV